MDGRGHGSLSVASPCWRCRTAARCRSAKLNKCTRCTHKIAAGQLAPAIVICNTGAQQPRSSPQEPTLPHRRAVGVPDLRDG